MATTRLSINYGDALRGGIDHGMHRHDAYVVRPTHMTEDEKRQSVIGSMRDTTAPDVAVHNEIGIDNVHRVKALRHPRHYAYGSTSEAIYYGKEHLTSTYCLDNAVVWRSLQGFGHSNTHRFGHEFSTSLGDSNTIPYKMNRTMRNDAARPLVIRVINICLLHAIHLASSIRFIKCILAHLKEMFDNMPKGAMGPGTDLALWMKAEMGNHIETTKLAIWNKDVLRIIDGRRRDIMLDRLVDHVCKLNDMLHHLLDTSDGIGHDNRKVSDVELEITRLVLLRENGISLLLDSFMWLAIPFKNNLAMTAYAMSARLVDTHPRHVNEALNMVIAQASERDSSFQRAYKALKQNITPLSFVTHVNCLIGDVLGTLPAGGNVQDARDRDFWVRTFNLTQDWRGVLDKQPHIAC